MTDPAWVFSFRLEEKKYKKLLNLLPWGEKGHQKFYVGGVKKSVNQVVYIKTVFQK